MTKKNTFAIFIALLSLGLLVFLARNHFLTKRSSTTLNLALDNTFDSLDPAKAYSDDSLVVSAQVLEPLYQYHYLKRPYEIQPLLAEDLPRYSDQGRTLTIKLKNNILYHPHPSFKGRQRNLKADDFVIQIKRLALDNLKSPGKSLFSGLIKGFDSFSSAINNDWKKIPNIEMEGVRALDSSTLQLSLTRPEPNIIYYLALNFIVPIPWEIVEFEKNNLDKILIGTGPYIVKSFRENYFELTKFHDYRKDYYPSSGDRYANMENLLESSKERIPFVDRVLFHVTAQESDRWNLFLDKKIDLITVPKTFIPRLYNSQGQLSDEFKNKDINLRHFPILANRWLAFNMRHPLVGNNLELRQAIAHAINYSEYIELLSQNTNLRANSILVPGISGYLPTKEFRYNYDPQLAKEYLKKAGFKTLEDIPTLTYSTRGNQAIHLKEAEFIKKELEAIGLKVNIQVLNFTDFIQKGRAGELMFFTDNWLFDYPDGENIIQLLVSKNFPGINKSGYSNKKVDLLYDQLKATTNLDRKFKLYQEIEDQVWSDLCWIPLMYESSFVLQYPEIKNFRKSSIIRNYVKYLKIEE